MKIFQRFNLEFQASLFYITNLDVFFNIQKLKYNKFKEVLKFYIDNPLVFYHRFRGAWKYSISFFLAWMITNGWAYILAFTGSKIATAYITMLWMPWTPEKLITFPISFYIHKKLWQENGKEAEQKMKVMVELAMIGQ